MFLIIHNLYIVNVWFNIIYFNRFIIRIKRTILTPWIIWRQSLYSDIWYLSFYSQAIEHWRDIDRSSCKSSVLHSGGFSAFTVPCLTHASTIDLVSATSSYVILWSNGTRSLSFSLSIFPTHISLLILSPL